MPWQLEFDTQNKAVCLRFSGDVTHQDVMGSSIAVIQMLQENGTFRIITDFSNVANLALSVFDIHGLPETYKELGMSTYFREAIICPDHLKIRKDVGFYETVCLNRGKNVKVFESRKDVLDWLVY